MSINFNSVSEKQFWQQESVHYLSGIQRGIEKESLRINAQGMISQVEHPKALGSTLTHRYITTDYSEALLEFITPATDERFAPIDWLEDIHTFVYQRLNDELLWATSMPCIMGNDEDIPLAYFGTSNSGRMKTVYREGLGHRYGRFMQTIAGVHFNFSFPKQLWQALQQAIDGHQLNSQDFQSDRYMGMIRNFQRDSWIIPMLFGASPALCESFLKGRPTKLDLLVPGTRFGKFATSLRMSDLGYQNNVQSALRVSTNDLASYVATLEHAIRTEDPYYKSIGVKVDDVYKQLNANVLQIENEFYSNIRPKRTCQSGERPTKALSNRGIEYIEVRALDINLFDKVGVTQQQLDFLDVFLLNCAMQSSCPITEREEAETKKNFARVVKGGRDPELYLWRKNRQVSAKILAHNLFDSFDEAAELLDKAYNTHDYSQVLKTLRSQIDEPETTISGQIVQQIQSRGDGFFPYAMELSKKYRDYFATRELSGSRAHVLEEEVQKSIDKQLAMEQGDDKTFEEFLASYFA
ncbi:MAG: glutamate--cysteine ligase [Gammaproteobacteria bacterium]|nr:glutamate--cysteine ligase [Gammaproteobacteria bacterium]